jgi:hypothetical protein
MESVLLLVATNEDSPLDVGYWFSVKTSKATVPEEWMDELRHVNSSIAQ